MSLFRRLLACAALLPGLAGAHDATSAGGVSVNMTTDANDLLRVGTPTQLVFFMIYHDELVLDASGCTCTALLYEGAPSARVRPLQLARLTSLPGGDAGASVTVTKPGLYTLVLDGRPVKFGDFDPFRLQYQLTAPENAVSGAGR